MVTLPYVKGVTEHVQRAMCKHRIVTPVKPHVKLRQLLVHPTDKISSDNECDIIYEILVMHRYENSGPIPITDIIISIMAETDIYRYRYL